MSGICGWFGDSMSSNEDVATINNMINQLSEFDDCERSYVVGDVCALGVSDYNNIQEKIYEENGNYAHIVGNPTIDNSNIGLDCKKYGLAKGLMYAYKNRGVDFLNNLSGIFSLAIYLREENKYIIANDRLGLSPVYYTIENNSILYSSSLRTFSSNDKLKNAISNQAIYDYLYFHVIPSPNTIYTNIFSFEPGYYIEKNNQTIKKERYWSIRYENEDGKGQSNEKYDDLKLILLDCIKNEVKGRDDVGCFLSGGLDSSTVAGFLGKAANSPAKTFSIGFSEKGFDETAYAKITSDYYKTIHHTYYVTPEDVINIVDKIPQIYGQPFGNSSAVPTYYCAKLANDNGVNKLLGGDGGDEIFGGNERYAVQKLFSVYGKFPDSIKRIIEPVIYKFPGSENIYPLRKIKRYIDQARVPMPERMFSYNMLTMMGVENIFDDDFFKDISTLHATRSMIELYDGIKSENFINNMLGMDLKITLADNDIPKVSGMCEFAGIEVGYPFLNDKLIRFSSTLPVNQKVHGMKLRYYFKKALGDFLPPEVITKKKHGFGLPFGNWMVSDSALHQKSCDALNDLKKRNIIKSQFIDTLINQKLHEHSTYYGEMVWLLMNLEYWFKGLNK